MDYVEKFLVYLKEEKNYSDLTILNYRRDLFEFYEISKEIDLILIDKSHIRFYLKELFSRNNKSSTVSRKISSLKSFYKYMKDLGYVQVNPVSSIRYPKRERSLPKFVQYNDLEDMINISKSGYFGDRNNLIIELMYSTGVRVSELVNIKLNDIEIGRAHV